MQRGSAARVRRQRWTVEEVVAFDDCRLLTLRRFTREGATRTRRVLQPFDDVELPARRTRPLPVGIRTWRAAGAALLADAVPAAGLRTAADARIDLLPYQLEPALALLHGRGSRLLIADDVGLGKTVQALLAFAELRARGAAMRALIVCPPGLRDQWAAECADRFGLTAVVFDPPGIHRVRARVAAAVNPWSTEPLVIVSVDFIKRAEVLDAALAASWDLVVVDEAHGVCGDSQRRSAVVELAARAAFVVLLTATPHSGDDAAFASLCGLGRIDDDRLVVFRRSRTELADDAGRRTRILRVRATPEARRLQAALDRLTDACARNADASGDGWLLLSLLHKRAMSSAFALAASAERRLRLVEDESGPEERQLPLPLDDPGGELDPSDAPPMWSAPLLQDRRRERELFVDLLAAARGAQAGDAKLACLARFVRRVREPAIVFTEYRDTLLHLRDRIGREAAVLHGGMTREQRRDALRRFDAVGLLLATDAAGEGLNLQQRCRIVINLELPWNPMRLEQRIGRVDRIGQRRRVHAVHLVGAGTREPLLLERIVQRLWRAQMRVGAPNPLRGRTEWTEELSARLVVWRESPAAGAVQSAAPDGQVRLTRLESEAAQESMRLAGIRVWLRHARDRGRERVPSVVRQPSLETGPLAAVARRWRSRARLGGRTLLIFRSTLADAAGRTVSTRLDGVLTECRDTPDGAAAVGSLVAAAPDFEQWTRTGTATHQQFLRLLLQRAEALDAWLGSAAHARQPGLFDQRSEREWQRLERRDAGWRGLADERRAQAEAGARLCLVGPELVLVLAPRP